jgi:hypothetical protein
MLKKIVLSAVITGSLLVASTLPGRSVTYWDIDVFADKLSSSNPVKSGLFDITTGVLGGYNPLTQTIYSATAWFALSDDQILDSDEWVQLKLDGLNFLTPIEVDLTLVSGQVTGSALVTLNSTGKLSYLIQRTAGDFWALGAKLMADAGPRSVPDGGVTLMLLGGGMAAIEFMRRLARRS